MSVFDRVSLIAGPLPWLLGIGAFATFAVILWRWRRPWWQLGATLAIAVVVLDLIAGLLHLPERLHGTYPPSFVVWAALPVVAAVAGGLAWMRIEWWRRGVAVRAVVLLALFAADRVDAFYGYIPTIGDLRGAPVVGQVSSLPSLASHATHLVGGHGRTALQWAMPARGVVGLLKIPGVVSHFHARDAWVWIPPRWFSRPHPVLPVLMLLAGTPGAPVDWLRGGHALRTLNQFADAHDGWGPIVVIPDNNGGPFDDTECVDAPTARAETYLTVDVVRTIEHRFGTEPGRHWGVAGLSGGGTCAVVLGLRHPELFAALGDFSGDPAPNVGAPRTTLRKLFGGSRERQLQYDPGYLLTHATTVPPVSWYGTGRNDSTDRVAALERYTALTRRAGGTATLLLEPGGHTFHVWTLCLLDALPSLARAIGLPARVAV